MGYVSPAAYACLSQDSANPDGFRSRHGAIPADASIEGRQTCARPADVAGHVLVGVRLSTTRAPCSSHNPPRAIRRLRGAGRHGRALECESRLTLANPAKSTRLWKLFRHDVLYRGTGAPTTVALLWAQEDDYWESSRGRPALKVTDTGRRSEHRCGVRNGSHQGGSKARRRRARFPRELAGPQGLRHGVRLPRAAGICVLRAGARPGAAGRNVAGGCRQEDPCSLEHPAPRWRRSKSRGRVAERPGTPVKSASWTIRLRASSPDERAERPGRCLGVRRPRGKYRDSGSDAARIRQRIRDDRSIQG